MAARLHACILASLLWLPEVSEGQSADTINVYRFILDVDVPEPPALVALGLAPGHVLRPTAPKPLAATLAFAHDSGDAATTSVALDIAPYFLAGGGIRRLSNYRSNTLGGRLLRVLTKTLLSVGAAWDPADPSSPRVGVALRSTLHDPHDPIQNTTLPEDVRSALTGHATPAPSQEDVSELGVDLSPLYRRARLQMQAKRDILVAAGWGFAGRLGGGVLDSLERVRHTLWLTSQYTLGSRFDVLATAQLWNGFGGGQHGRIGAALQRKTTLMDLITELYFDTADDRLHPGAWIEGRVVPRLRAGVSLSSETDPAGGAAQLRIRTMVRWYLAQKE